MIGQGALLCPLEGEATAVTTVPPGSVFPRNGSIVSIHGRSVGIICSGGGDNSNGVHSKSVMDMESMKTHSHHKGKHGGASI